MGRILIVVGVLMLVASFALPFLSSFGLLTDIGGIVNDAAQQPTAEELCNPGETLDIVEGPPTRTGTGSSATTGRSQQFFCVDSTGERRDVTATVASNLLSSVTGSTGIGDFIRGSLGSVGLTMGGIALIVVGVLLVGRASRRPRQVFGVQAPFNPSNLAGNSPVGTPPSTPVINVDQNTFGQQNQNSVMNFVRDQLDAAYRSGQISREDYDRAIEKLNQR